MSDTPETQKADPKDINVDDLGEATKSFVETLKANIKADYDNKVRVARENYMATVAEGLSGWVNHTDQRDLMAWEQRVTASMWQRIFRHRVQEFLNDHKRMKQAMTDMEVQVMNIEGEVNQIASDRH